MIYFDTAMGQRTTAELPTRLAASSEIKILAVSMLLSARDLSRDSPHLIQTLSTVMVAPVETLVA